MSGSNQTTARCGRCGAELVTWAAGVLACPDCDAITLADRPTAGTPTIALAGRSAPAADSQPSADAGRQRGNRDVLDGSDFTKASAGSQANRQLFKLRRLLAEARDTAREFIADHGDGCACPFCEEGHTADHLAEVQGIAWTCDVGESVLSSSLPVPPAERSNRRELQPA